MSISIGYPSVLPLDELRTLYAKAKGETISTPELLHAAWVVSGYGLSQFGGALPVGESDSETLEPLAALETLVAPVPPIGGIAASLVWPVVIKLALKILSELAG